MKTKKQIKKPFLNCSYLFVIASLGLLSQTTKTNTISLEKTTLKKERVYKGKLRVNTQAAIDALPFYTKITGDLIIGYKEATNDITDLSKFSKLKEVGGRLFVQRCPLIKNLKGLSALKSIGNNDRYGGYGKGELIIREMSSLKSLDGLQNLNSIADDLGILNNRNLTSLEGLQNLNYLGNRLWIGVEGWRKCDENNEKLNPKLQDLCALKNIIVKTSVLKLERNGSCIQMHKDFTIGFKEIAKEKCSKP